MSGANFRFDTAPKRPHHEEAKREPEGNGTQQKDLPHNPSRHPALPRGAGRPECPQLSCGQLGLN